MTATHSSEDVQRYMIVYYAALYAIVWYDWLVLLTKEYRKIWRADWSLLKFFYLANRYSTLALTIVVWAGFGMNVQTNQCNTLLGFQDTFPLLVYFFSGFILILRCYVIWGRSSFVAGGLLALHLAHIGISAWTIVQAKSVPFDGTGPCIPKDTHIMSAFYTCFSALVFDVAASILSLWKAFTVRKQYAVGVPSVVLDNLIKNGSFYICGTVLAACGNMAFRFLSDSPYDTPMQGYAGGNFCVVASSILVSRLALSLKGEPEARRSRVFSSSGLEGQSSSTVGGSASNAFVASKGSSSMSASKGFRGSGTLNPKSVLSTFTTSRGSTAAAGSEVNGKTGGRQPVEVAVTRSVVTHIDAPSLDPIDKDWMDSDLEMQDTRSRSSF